MPGPQSESPDPDPDPHGHALLDGAVGRRLEAVARIHYEQPGVSAEWEMGPLELRFGGGPALVLTTGDSGEIVRVEPGPWRDWLETEDATAEDRADAARHGKFTRFDARERPGYGEALGRTLEAVRWMANDRGSVGGAELVFEGGARLAFVSEGDEEYVFAGGAAAVPAEWGFRHLPPEGRPATTWS